MSLDGIAGVLILSFGFLSIGWKFPIRFGATFCPVFAVKECLDRHRGSADENLTLDVLEGVAIASGSRF